jgi:DNA-binding Lrp family transcriptional regulator
MQPGVIKAYIFVTVATKAKLREAAQEIERVGGIKSADLCWGLPDIIAIAEAPDMKALETMIVDRVQRIAGDKTGTHIVASP